MGKPDKTGKTLVQFNVKNAVYALVGVSSPVKPLTYMNTLTKDRNVTVKNLYGDGELQDSLSSDRSISGAVGTTARDTDFEKDLGIMMETDAGLAEIAVKSTQRVNIGFETEYKEKGMPVKTKKVWILNVQVSPPNESLTQNQDDITESTYDYNYTGYGVNLKDSAGSEDYVDENGNTVRIYTATALPDDDNYDTFLDSVPTPKAKTA